MTYHKKIEILLVEDSILQQEILKNLLESDRELSVVKMVCDGVQAIEALKNMTPDIVIMDLHMPKMNGVEAIKQIMQTRPIPIIAISASIQTGDPIDSFHALEAGAIAFAEKPINLNKPHHDAQCHYLIQLVKSLANVPVLPKIKEDIKDKRTSHALHKSNTKKLIKPEIIAIGVSTGGPLALKELFSGLPKHFPPILVVQHIASGFIHGLTEWLSQETLHSISIATAGTLPKRNHIYFAPDNFHMGIAHNKHIFLERNHDNLIQCPAISFLFRTVSEVYKNKAMGVLMTGMGNDGVLELKMMNDQGAVTVAQNKETSLIYGLPEEAIRIKAVQYVLSPKEIANTISTLDKIYDEKH